MNKSNVFIFMIIILAIAYYYNRGCGCKCLNCKRGRCCNEGFCRKGASGQTICN